MSTDKLTQRLVGFVHHLRAEGYAIGIQEVIDMLACMEGHQIANMAFSHRMIRSLVCNNLHDWYRFDELFRHYWLDKEKIDTELSAENSSNRAGVPAGGVGFGGSTMENQGGMHDLGDSTGSGAGRQKTVSKADFRFLNDPGAMREIETLAERLALQLNKRFSRRYKLQSHGRRIALRQTLRRNLSQGGLPARLLYQDRIREPIPLVILHDVSHSMAWNNPLLFRFARGLIRAFRNSEAFAFHTKLFRVTEFYREVSLKKMQQKLEARNHLWMGGTCIAESLEKFNQHYAADTLNTQSVVIILSDGFDTDAPDYLADQLRQIRKVARKIIWLNPMIGRDGYQPDDASMQAAIPHIDRLDSANNLDALKQTVTYIARECR